MIELFDYQQLLYATDGFSPARLIGKGSHGSVYKALLQDHSVVAVKKPLQTHLEAFRDNSKLENEARVLSSLRHNPLVVNFLGTSLDSGNNKLLVMEFMPNGSLHDLLLAASSPPLSWSRRLQIITQIARAVQLIHQANPLVIHRDIKAENILFDSEWNLKLADFGLAVSLHSDCLSHASQRQPAGTIGYLDPCYTTPSKLSTKTDVFSFGVVVLEVISGRKAIDVSKSPSSIIDWATPLIKGRHFQKIYDTRIPLPKYLEGTTRKLLHVAARCVSPDQGQRPSMAEIVEGMERSRCCIERVKCPFWSRVLVLVRSRRRRRMAKEGVVEGGGGEEGGRGQVIEFLGGVREVDWVKCQRLSCRCTCTEVEKEEQSKSKWPNTKFPGLGR